MQTRLHACLLAVWYYIAYIAVDGAYIAESFSLQCSGYCYGGQSDFHRVAAFPGGHHGLGHDDFGHPCHFLR